MNKYLVPIIIYFCFVTLYLGLSIISGKDTLFQPLWDIRQYVNISEQGYQVYPCTPGVEYPQGRICGNPGWHPFWPIVAAAIRPLLGGSSRLTFILLPYLFSFLFFLMLFRFVEIHYNRNAATVALLAIAFGPGSFYLITGFPYALFMLLFISYLFLLYGSSGIKREIGLFALGWAISLTYPTGILLAILPSAWYIFSGNDYRASPKTMTFWLQLIKYAIPFILGPLLLWGYFYFRFDDFLLQFHFQEKFNRLNWANPLVAIGGSLTKYSLFSPENAVLLWYGLIFLLFISNRMRKEFWILALAFYLFSPATGTTMSIYRHYLIILPSYIMIGTSSRPLWLKLAFIAAGLFLAIKTLFPLYISYRLI
ncbi:MAG: hypothetical protein NTV06_05935 [candidate division Zixibacteria bacterium]|nr:hypothetical protein [candidate division Zixibacteria bacterium]